MINKNHILLSVLACLFYVTSFAQENTVEPPKRRGLPDIPGTFLVELGFNRALGAPSDFDIGFWGSRTLNIYYQLDRQIGNSKFSFHPGLGFASERYKFRNNRTLAIADGNTVLLPSGDAAGYPRVSKSMLVTNYFDIIAEFRFSTNPDDPSRSFKASIGGRAGYLFDSFNKVKFTDDGEKTKVKNKQSFNLNDFRYGLFFKVGAGNFSVFSYYDLSTLFNGDSGPGGKEINDLTIGISLGAF